MLLLEVTSEIRVGGVLASKYRLEELLGSGGMGHVYRAVNDLVGRPVAIKVLRPEHASNKEVVDRFLREAKVANLVRHPNVVDVLDIGTHTDGTPFIVQELLRGKDLSKFAAERGGKLILSDIVDVLCPIIDAIAVAHHAGVVHRDLKPENVFLAQVGQTWVPKLLDFGISKVRSFDRRMTEVGVMMGTPAYMAPEQVQGSRDADARSDVWALGVMLFELMSGRMPFDASDAPALFISIATTDAPRLEDINPLISRSVSKIVERCLRRLPSERYPTAAELARDLRIVLVLGQDDLDDLEPTGKRSLPPSALTAKVPELAVKVPTAKVPDLDVDSVKPHAPTMPMTPAPTTATPSEGRSPPGSNGSEQVGTSGKTVPTSPAFAVPPSEQAPSAPSLPVPPPKPPRSSGKDAAAAPRASSSNPVAAARATPSQPMQPAATPRANRIAPDQAMPGVMMAPNASAAPSQPVRRAAPSHAAWGVEPPQPTNNIDYSLLTALLFVPLVVIVVVWGLLQFVHQPEGWPIAHFMIKTTGTENTAIQGFLGFVAFLVGAQMGRRGTQHWRNELAGGKPGAILNAVIAGGFFFAAIELFRAAW